MNFGSVPLRILVADELDIVRDGLRTLLGSHPGWEICAEAVNGREAVGKAIQFRPDIVVLDLGIPELNGLEATRQIRKALPDTEIMLLAPQDSEPLAQEALEAGAGSFIPKADAKSVLISAVESLAQHRPFFAAKTPALPLCGRVYSEIPWAKTRRPRCRLTPREREIVQLVAEGKTSREIAAMLGRSVKTVEAHRANIMNKLGLQSITELVRYAVRDKIVEG